MKNVMINTRDIEAIKALCENVKSIGNAISASRQYEGIVVSWSAVAQMHTGVCRKLLDRDITTGPATVALAADLIDRLAQVYAITDLAMSVLGERWAHFDSLKAFAYRCDRLRAGLHCAIYQVA